jgi:hypothetical protein
MREPKRGLYKAGNVLMVSLNGATSFTSRLPILWQVRRTTSIALSMLHTSRSTRTKEQVRVECVRIL